MSQGHGVVAVCLALQRAWRRRVWSVGLVVVVQEQAASV